jgi:large subunit ribosomal protein L13
LKTFTLKAKDIKKNWYLIDAKDQILGRLSSRIAQLIRGKGKPEFTPHLDMGDFVIVINADKIKVTGNKEKAKTYWRHSGFPGGQKESNLSELKKKFPDRVITNAVKGMLPHNRLGKKMLKNLKVYVDDNHPHEAQNPTKIDLN